jgi:hypothetical protein
MDRVLLKYRVNLMNCSSNKDRKGHKEKGILKSERHNAQANSNVHICKRMIEKTRALKDEKRKLH